MIKKASTHLGVTVDQLAVSDAAITSPRTRSIAVLKATAEPYGYSSWPSPHLIGKNNILPGGGIAYSFGGETPVRY